MKNLFRFNDWPLAVKLIVTMTTLSVLALVSAAVISNIFTQNLIEKRITNELTTFASEQGTRIGPLLENEINLVNVSVALDNDFALAVEEINAAYSGSPSAILNGLQALDAEWQAGTGQGEELAQALLNNDASEILYDFAEAVPDHLETFVTDKYGAVVALNNRTSDYYQADEEWWQLAWNDGEGAIYISDPVYDESVDAIVIEIALPVMDVQTGEVYGVMKDVYAMSRIVEHAQAAQYGETGELRIISSQGTYIVDPHLAIGTPAEPEHLFDGRIFEGAGIELNAVGHEGERVVVAYAPVSTEGGEPAVDQLGWVVQVSQSRDEAFAAIRQNTVSAGIVTVVASVLAVGVALALTRLLVRQVSEFDRVFRAVGVGQFDARVQVFGNDELGRAGEGFNALLEQMMNLLEQVQETAQSEINQIFNTAADGMRLIDLEFNTVRANETFDNMVGKVNIKPTERLCHAEFSSEICDNEQCALKRILAGESLIEIEVEKVSPDGTRIPTFMTATPFRDETGEIIGIVEDFRDITAQRLAEEQIHDQNEALRSALQDLQSVATEVETTAEDVTTATEAMNQVVTLMAGQATSSAEMADQAATSAQGGDQAVTETIAAMTRIRSNTQETAQRIKRLGEVSQEIGEATRLIEDLSDRTTVLALNASIQAAAAGEAGRGFAVVAEEVQRLAERATGATRQIEELITNIRAEANEAMVSVEEVTREVVEGSTVAQNAGEHMTTLNQLANELNNLIQHLVDTTVTQTNDSLSSLGDLTHNLRTTVAGFGTPELQTTYQGGNGSHEMPHS